MSSRRNALIRTVAAITGDIATGIAVASACLWLIEAATLGLFLSFMLWLLALLVSLALSQHLVYPATQLLLSDQKLDAGLAALAGLSRTLVDLSDKARMGLWSTLRQGARRFHSGPQMI